MKTITLSRAQLRSIVEHMGWEREDVDNLWHMALKEQESPGYHARARVRYWRRVAEQATGVKAGEKTRYEARVMGQQWAVYELDDNGKVKGIKAQHASFELADHEARTLQAAAYNRDPLTAPADPED